MDSYVYPFDEFLRDFAAVTPSPNATLRGWAHDQSAIMAYFERNYPSAEDASERSLALNMIWTYIQRHMDEFDTGHIAIVGSQTALSHDLLRAVHHHVCPYVFGDASETPAPSVVLALAKSYANDQ